MLLIADTSVLINFLNVDRMYLLGKHVPSCVITEHVVAEISELYPKQIQVLRSALDDNHIQVMPVGTPEELDIFVRIQKAGRLGAGESSAIAAALARGYSLAIDDRRAIRDARLLADEMSQQLTILRTQDIVARLIKSSELSLEQADILLVSWRSQHRFDPGIASFAELLSN